MINSTEGKKEGNVLFNDTLNTDICLIWLYGFGHMVRKEGNVLVNDALNTDIW